MGKQRLPLWFDVLQPYRNRAMALLSAVKADGLAFRKLGSLSSEELQRVLLAMALEQEPDLLLLNVFSRNSCSRRRHHFYFGLVTLHKTARL